MYDAATGMRCVVGITVVLYKGVAADFSGRRGYAMDWAALGNDQAIYLDAHGGMEWGSVCSAS